MKNKISNILFNYVLIILLSIHLKFIKINKTNYNIRKEKNLNLKNYKLIRVINKTLYIHILKYIDR